MHYALLIGSIIVAAVAGDDSVSLLQSRAAKQEAKARKGSTTSYDFTWNKDALKTLVSNNLGGYGPISGTGAEEEMRFYDVGVADGNIHVDLKITTVDHYWDNDRTSDNGKHKVNFGGSTVTTEFARIFVRINSANKFLFQFVKTGTNTPVTVKKFDFPIIDIDQGCLTCYCGEEVVVWGASGYYALADAYSHIGVTSSAYSDSSAIAACSNVTIGQGWVTDPQSFQTMAQMQGRATIVYHFENTAQWQVGFVVLQKGPRALVFGGANNPLIWEPDSSTWHHVQSAIIPPEFEEGHGQVYRWSVDGQEASVTANNLGGRGPIFTDPHYIRFSKVGELVDHDEYNVETGKRWLDLVVYTEDQYWGSDYINEHWNGANGEYGEIGLSRRSEASMIFTFVETESNEARLRRVQLQASDPARAAALEPVVVPAFDFTIFDIDNMADPSLGEEYTVYGATNYALVDDAFTIVDASKTNAVHLKSHVTIDSGAIPNPSSWVNLTEDQARVAVQFRFVETAQWTVHFKITAIRDRAFLFGGQSRPALTRIGRTKSIITMAPTMAPTVYTGSPTVSPTGSPTGGTSTVFGDPHVRNVAGEAFDINRASSHTFIIIPRAAKPADVQLKVQGYVTPRGDACSGQLYLTSLTVTGEWVGAAERLEFLTQGDDFLTGESVGLKYGDSANMSVDEFSNRIPGRLGKVELPKETPLRPQELNKHVTILVVRLYLGPLIMKISWEHQKERVGYSNSLMLLTYGLRSVHAEVGGLLGMDDHRWAASMPDECDTKGSQRVARQDRHRVAAAAFLDLEDADRGDDFA